MYRRMTAILIAVTMICLTNLTTLADSWQYRHDPTRNDTAMRDVVVNPDAVYGFSPNPESTRLGVYASYDWTDPEFVAQAKAEREAYHQSLYTMYDILHEMRDSGSSVEEMARAVSAERNRLRLASYDNDPEGLAKVKKSNLETYGQEEGPTADQLFEKYGSWETVLQKAFSGNPGMDACCGLYDEYYSLYVELGMVPADEEEEEDKEGDEAGADADSQESDEQAVTEEVAQETDEAGEGSDTVNEDAPQAPETEAAPEDAADAA